MRYRIRASGGVAVALLALVCLTQTVQGQEFQFAGQGAKRLLVRTSDQPWSAFSTDWVTVTSMTVEVPASFNEGLIFARFSAESRCAAFEACLVRILVDGDQAGRSLFFDDGYADTWSSLSTERTSAVLSSGVHTVSVQGLSVFGDIFKLDSWQLTIETWKVS